MRYRNPLFAPVAIEALELRRLMSSYYVSPAGSDSNAGTSAAPFKTIQRAANLAVAGDLVNVRAGTYAGFSVGWDVEQNGTAAKPITFKAESVVLITSKNSHTADGINGDIHADPEYRAHLIGVMAKQAVAQATGKA